MLIDKQKTYTEGRFTYRNFVTLSREEALFVLRERNNPRVKQWMYSQDDIAEDAHFRFLEGLKGRDDAFYWLMSYDGKPIGVLSLVHCNYEAFMGEPGYYLFSDYLDSGLGLEMQCAYKRFFFTQLGVERLIGHILPTNTSALQLSLFMGGEVQGTIEENGRAYLEVITPKDAFLEKTSGNVVMNFLRFVKKNRQK